MEPAGRSLLAIAANAKPLHTGALRIALGDRMLPHAATEPPGSDGIRVAARLAPVADPSHTELLATRLGSVLPRVSPGRLERIMHQIVSLGYPVLAVEGTLPLPVLPYEYERPDGPGHTARTARPSRAFRKELLPAPRSLSTAHPLAPLGSAMGNPPLGSAMGNPTFGLPEALTAVPPWPSSPGPLTRRAARAAPRDRHEGRHHPRPRHHRA